MTTATKVRPRLILNPDADEDAWLDERRHGITATDIPKICGVHPYGSAWEVFQDKVDPRPKFDPGPAARWGHILEPLIADEWAKENAEIGRVVPAAFYAHGVMDWVRATPDRLVYRPERYRGTDGQDHDAVSIDPIGLLEVKSALGFASLDWDEDRAPDAALFQTLWQLVTMDLDRAWLVALAGPRGLITHVIDRAENQQLIDDLLTIGEQFWTEHVCKRIPPSPDGSDRLAKLLNKRWEPDPDKTVVLPRKQYEQLVTQRNLAAAEVKSAKERQNEAENALRVLLADAEAGMLDGQVVVTWRESPRAGYTVAPSTVRTLRFPKPKGSKS
jgi:putative phage-type endonuclease